MLRHFDETMTLLISNFLRFGVLKIATCDYFVLRINEITYSKHNKKFDVLLISVFSHHFPHSVFPYSFVQGGVQITYG